ncbi:MAG: DNA/RNA non-specific endonuclease [bacterium]
MSLTSIKRRPTFWLAALLIAGACTAGVDRLGLPLRAPASAHDLTATSASGLVISQVYGGGGNAGATLKNDFIEIYNGSANTISLAGFSVQYASSAGTSWQVTPLTGSIASGQYYLVQEAVGANGTTSLPTPDATGTIAMSATAGKVALLNTTAAQSATTGCPFAATVVDFVGYGTGANCSEGSGPTAAVANATAASRKDFGRQDTNDNAADFAVGAPNPRNTASPVTPPLTTLSAAITPVNPNTTAGGTVSFTATASQGGSSVPVTSSAWTSSNTAAATIDPVSGVATGVAIGTTTIGVTVTTASGTATSSTTLTVSGTAASVVVSPTTWTLKSGQGKTFTAQGFDAGNNPVATTVAWSSSNTAIATIDPTSGAAVGHAVGSATITATAPNNVTGTATIIVTAGNITVQARTTPLPVGFQTQFFLNNGGTDSNGNPVGNSQVTWSSANPAVLTIDAITGIVTAKAAGSTVITATATTDGISSGSTTVDTDVEPTSPSARVGHNTELGTPTDADPSDDVIISRRNYTLSYNVNHGGPNWVSWNLDATHTGSASRCNCFTADTALTRMGIHAWDTNDWVNGGVWSRGHMSPSADWADVPGDNAPTFFLSNMIPQNQTANAGSWGALENFLRTQVGGTNEIYIIAGPIFTKNRSGPGVDGFGFMNSTGHIAVPDSMWKIAIIVPDARSASQITSPTGLQVIAVNMPNDASVTGAFTNYNTTIAKIQQSTGYDLLNGLPEQVQCRLETRNCAPVASVAAVTGATEGAAVAFDASASTDADGDVLTYSWTFGDGGTGNGVSPSHTYADNGTYSAIVTVTDGKGGTASFTRSVSVANALPVPTMTPTSTTVQAGTVFNPNARFTDAGSKDATWKAVITWGDGTTLNASLLTQTATPIRASKVYTTPGTYTVRFTVTDKDGGAATVQTTVTVTP